MSFKYNKLLALLALKGLQKTDLIKLAGLSSKVVAKISKNEYISMESLDKICKTFNVQLDEIVEHIPDNK